MKLFQKFGLDQSQELFKGHGPLLLVKRGQKKSCQRSQSYQHRRGDKGGRETNKPEHYSAQKVTQKIGGMRHQRQVGIGFDEVPAGYDLRQGGILGRRKELVQSLGKKGNQKNPGEAFGNQQKRQRRCSPSDVGEEHDQSPIVDIRRDPRNEGGQKRGHQKNNHPHRNGDVQTGEAEDPNDQGEGGDVIGNAGESPIDEQQPKITVQHELKNKRRLTA